MSDVSKPQGSYSHTEDVAVVAPGSVVLSSPCTIWDMTVSEEEAVVAVISFSDNSDGYDSTYRNRKVVLNGPQTVHLVFPKGLYCSRGLSAIANNGSVDVSVTYD